MLPPQIKRVGRCLLVLALFMSTLSVAASGLAVVVPLDSQGSALKDLGVDDSLGEAAESGRGRGKRPRVLTTRGSFVFDVTDGAAGGSGRELGEDLEDQVWYSDDGSDMPSTVQLGEDARVAEATIEWQKSKLPSSEKAAFSAGFAAAWSTVRKRVAHKSKHATIASESLLGDSGNPATRLFQATIIAPAALLSDVPGAMCSQWQEDDANHPAFVKRQCSGVELKGGIDAIKAELKADLPYNSTHVDKNPKNNPGKLINDDKYGDRLLANCLTQTTIIENGKKRTDFRTCTSCKPGTVFQMFFAKSRVGICQKPTTNPVIHCTNGEQNSYDVRWHQHDQVVCSKYTIFHSKVAVRASGQEAQKHFRPVTKDNKDFTAGLAIARCQGWKTVSCKAGKCVVIKEVECLDICRYQIDKYQNGNNIGDCKASQDKALRAVQKFESHMQNLKLMGQDVNQQVHTAAWRYKQELKKPKPGCTPLCDKSLCKAPYGEMACKGTVITL